VFDFLLAPASVGQVILLYFVLGTLANISDAFVGYRHSHRGKGRA
jgi:hypothetical protein